MVNQAMKLIVGLIVFLFITGMGNYNMTKFDWLASESAPKNYPMKVIKGDFFFPDNGSLYIPNGKRVDGGWGVGVSTHIVGDDLKSLPDRLEITYFSYTEDKFYSGEFSLPYERILKLFNEGYYSPTDEEDITYHYIIAGIAPGGTVSVWLSGTDKSVEVFSGQAKEVDIDWDEFTGEKLNITRKEYIESAINEELSSEAKIKLLQNGVPVERWSKYHKSRFHWRLTLVEMKLRDNRTKRVYYFNGEEGYLEIASDEKLPKDSSSVPKSMSIVWNRTGYLKDDLIINMDFDEAEIFSAFEAIGRDDMAFEMEFRMEPEKNYDFTVWLQNEKDSIELKKTKIKTWKPGGMRYENAGPKDTE